VRSIPLLLLALSSCAADVDFTCGGDAPMCDILEVTADNRRPASGIQITGVSVTQGVHLGLVEDGVALDQAFDVVAGRDAVFRVYVQPDSAWQTRAITARVTLMRDGVVVGAGQADGTPGGESDVSDLNSTLNVRLDGEMIPEGELSYKVELLETPDGSGPGSSAGAVWPRDGQDTIIDVDYNGPALRIYLVPIQWDVDGSGQLPTTTPEEIERYKAAMMQLYPIADIEIEVGEPFPWNFPSKIASDTLSEVSSLRSERGIDDSQYIYGILNPPDGWGNPTGLSGGAGQRAAIGYSFDQLPSGAGGTMAHEVGHSHGLAHAPCGGAAGPDPNFPYDEGGIGVHGYDLASDTLIQPSEYKDMMGYCSPNWISDYYWEQIFLRSKSVWRDFGESDISSRARTEGWRTLWVHSDGRVTQGDITWLRGAPEGQERTLQVDGAPVTGIFDPFHHVEGGVLYVPTRSEVQSVAFEGGEVIQVEELR